MNTTMRRWLVVAVLFLVTLAAAPMSSQAATLTDVPANDPNAREINWAADNVMQELLDNNYFRPQSVMTEVQLARALAHLDKDFPSFNGFETSVVYNFYEEYNIPYKGTFDNAGRNENVTRGDFARIYAAFKGYDLSELYAVQLLYINEVTAGKTDKRTYEDFAPNEELTRLEAAKFLYNIARKGNFSVKGISGEATGKDNQKITLPAGFTETPLPIPTPEADANDSASNPAWSNRVKNMDITKTELNANGRDMTNIAFEFNTCTGADVNKSKSYTFEVTSKFGAQVIDSTGEVVRTVQSDGGSISVNIIAPALTRSVVDIISFKMVSTTSDSTVECYTRAPVNAQLQYTPKAEMVMNYEVFDPQQPQEDQGDVDPLPDPLPGLPFGEGSTGTDVFLTAGEVDIRDIDISNRIFTARKYESYRDDYGLQQNNDLITAFVDYEYAALLYEGTRITPEIFERIVETYLYGDTELDIQPIDTYLKVIYTVNDEGRIQFEIMGLHSVLPIHEEADEYYAFTPLMVLQKFVPTAATVAIGNRDSVEVLRGMFNDLSNFDKDSYLLYQSGRSYSDLQSLFAKMDSLIEANDKADVPPGFDGYTKVLVTLSRPGGQIITDYLGDVEISFNGETQVAKFVTNTIDHTTGKGSAGVAVAYFNSIAYGESEISAQIVRTDAAYDSILKDVVNEVVTKQFYTSQPFSQKTCLPTVEMAYLLDYSGSMNRVDQENARATETHKFIRHMEQATNIAMSFGRTTSLEAKGNAVDVANLKPYNDVKGRGVTDIPAAMKTALTHYTTTTTEKVMILISDGKTRTTNLDNVIQEYKTKGIKVYTIGYGTGAQIDDNSLRKIATQTGGQYFNVSTIMQLHNVYEALTQIILCKTVVDACVYDSSIFTNVSVRSTRTLMAITASVNEACGDIVSLVASYELPRGTVDFTLKPRNESNYRLTMKRRQLSGLAIQQEMQIKALDADGNVLATKQIEQALPNMR
ncbi:MAG: VWA domain-containing protein [Caryophanon sp.]|nr:VWA domain-containing protein [Caryophanon sp.]